MNNLKFGVLAFGVLGLIGVFLPMVGEGDISISFWKLREMGAADVYLTLAGFAAAAVMGILSVTKPPMLRWQSIVAIAGFGIVLFVMRKALPTDLFKMAIGAKLMGLSLFGGLIVSVLTLAKPETAK